MATRGDKIVPELFVTADNYIRGLNSYVGQMDEYVADVELCLVAYRYNVNVAFKKLRAEFVKNCLPEFGTSDRLLYGTSFIQTVTQIFKNILEAQWINFKLYLEKIKRYRDAIKKIASYDERAFFNLLRAYYGQNEQVEFVRPKIRPLAGLVPQ
jgi:hypothetical protein